MLIAPLLVAYLYFASLSLSGLAFLLYRYERHSPDQEGIAGIPAYVGMVALALAVLVWLNLCVAGPSPLATHAEAQPWLAPQEVHAQD